ncbi:hypothetical protein BX666DRAFT_1090677 [Dichotomocladium elegans]|nr:hypothetical protein BX666DRAFT_1090677 [Dichotomocladium elegans]
MVLSKKSGNAPQTSIMDWLAQKRPKRREKENALSPQEMRDLQRALALSQREYSLSNYNKRAPHIVDSQDEDDDFQSLVRSRPLILDRRRQSKTRKHGSSKMPSPPPPSEHQQRPKDRVQVKQERSPRVIEIDDLGVSPKIKEEKEELSFDIDDLFSASGSSMAMSDKEEEEMTLPIKEERSSTDSKTLTLEIEELFCADEPLFDANRDDIIPTTNQKGKEREQLVSMLPMTMTISPPDSHPEDPICPLCDQEYPLSLIEQHASECNGRIAQPSPSRPRLRRRLSRTRHESEPIPNDYNDNDVITINESPRREPPPPRRPFRRRRRGVLSPSTTNADLTADIDIFTDEEEGNKVVANQGFQPCPLCHNWIMTSELEAHVNAELEQMEPIVPDSGASPSHTTYRSSTTDAIIPHESHDSTEIVALSDDDDDASSDYSVLDITAEPDIHTGNGYGEDEGDDGYLSPLEGFVSLEQLREQDPAYQRYFDQTSGSNPSNRARAGGSSNTPRRRRQTQTSKRNGRKKAFWKGRGRTSKVRRKRRQVPSSSGP